MLNKAIAKFSRHGPSTEGHGGRPTARNRSHVEAGIRRTALLLCILTLVVATSALTVLAAPPGHDDGSEATTEESIAAGKNLFTGSTRFQEGGPPCLACHSIAGIGALGGGAMGPNLTGTFSKFGAGMVIMPEGIPPMRAIFMDKPLTADEKEHLLAFFESASVTERTTSAVLQLTGLAIAGTALMMGLAHLTWLRRSRNVRKTMVGHQGLRSS